MSDVGQDNRTWPNLAAVFGASGGIGAALVSALVEQDVQVLAGSRSGDVLTAEGVTPFRFDLTDEASIADAIAGFGDTMPDLVVVASGTLTLADGTGPERSHKSLNINAMEQVFRINAHGPALIAKHVFAAAPRKGRTVFAALSARVGSIGDNRVGGWYSYRASKAALNMLLKTFSIEVARTHKEAVVAGLHPGTVDTALSEPFQSNLPDGQLTQPDDAASALLSVLRTLTPVDSGGVFAYDGERVPD
ncbi:MAG: SDR family NAD(P)-dependent oxidoreductase [Parerythrobacter sp.]